MWYNRRHENAHFYPPLDPGRTLPDPGRITFIRCLRVAPLPNLTGLGPWRASPGDRAPTGLRRPDGAQRDQGLQCGWAGGVAGGVIASPSTAYDLHARRSRAPQRPVA